MKTARRCRTTALPRFAQNPLGWCVPVAVWAVGFIADSGGWCGTLQS